MDQPLQNVYELDKISCTALKLLNTYNHFLMPPVEGSSPIISHLVPPDLGCLPPYCPHRPAAHPHQPMVLGLSLCESEARRRGEKRPIPIEMKDEKYFERRRRNNQAAKKSRDARRMREDQIAWRACVLEQENASLRAHVAALTQEALALRSLLAAKNSPRTAAAPSSTTSD